MTSNAKDEQRSTWMIMDDPWMKLPHIRPK
jgi:hypothetical protein